MVYIDVLMTDEAELVRVGCRRYGRTVHNTYGPGSGPIWLDNVHCTGSETSIANCQHNFWQDHNCNHTQDVAIVCNDDRLPTPPSNNGRNCHSSIGVVSWWIQVRCRKGPLSQKSAGHMQNRKTKTNTNPIVLTLTDTGGTVLTLMLG